MKLKAISLSLVTTILFTGCVGTGPNTQRGSVAGGAIGALAGAIIGNNSGGHNGLAGALIGGTIGAIAGGAIGNAQDHQENTIYQESIPVEVVTLPPQGTVHTEIITAMPSPDYVWVNGYWLFNGTDYVWISGRWTMPPRHDAMWIEPRWEFEHGRYFYRRGYWRGRR